MNWVLDDPVYAGEMACVAVSEVDVSASHVVGNVVVRGEKRPALVLFLGKQSVTGIDLQGRVLDVNEIEQQYPNAVAQAVVSLKSWSQ